MSDGISWSQQQSKGRIVHKNKLQLVNISRNVYTINIQLTSNENDQPKEQHVNTQRVIEKSRIPKFKKLKIISI
jgi:signal recognition particle subunit SEC65